MTRSTLRTIVAVATLGACAGSAATAPAVVPPRDCGKLSIGSKRYQIKVDQISCRDGKGYSRTYLRRRAKPRGYTCKSYPARKNRVSFYCNNGRKVFFAIRR